MIPESMLTICCINFTQTALSKKTEKAFHTFQYPFLIS